MCVPSLLLQTNHSRISIIASHMWCGSCFQCIWSSSNMPCEQPQNQHISTFCCSHHWRYSMIQCSFGQQPKTCMHIYAFMCIMVHSTCTAHAVRFDQCGLLFAAAIPVDLIVYESIMAYSVARAHAVIWIRWNWAALCSCHSSWSDCVWKHHGLLSI